MLLLNESHYMETRDGHVMIGSGHYVGARRLDEGGASAKLCRSAGDVGKMVTKHCMTALTRDRIREMKNNLKLRV